MTRRIAIVTDEPGWHGAQLRKTFRKHGYEADFISLQACAIVLDTPGRELSLPGFPDALPAGVFVRGVPGGTLEEVVFYLDILHGLEECGVPVYNSARMIERSVDKGMTSFLLSRAGVETSPSWVAKGAARVEAIVAREIAAGFSVVCKPVFGSQGKGVQRIDDIQDLPDPELVNGIYYLQRYIETGRRGQWFDWRVLVVGGYAVAAMQRSSRQWITNVAGGAQCRPAVLNEPLRRLAERASAALGLHYGGVDILRDSKGNYRVLEVNGIPAWRGLQGTQQIDLGELLAQDFLRLVVGREQLEEIA